MREYKIYLSGGMMKFGEENFNEGNIWRDYCKKILEETECEYKVKVFNPNTYFSFKGEPKYDSDREVMRFDLLNLRESDIVIVYFNDKYSLGTMAEIAIAYENKIPVIGLDMSNDIHPWQKEMCERIFQDIDELLSYVENFYLK